jgi:hypothetical protein
MASGTAAVHQEDDSLQYPGASGISVGFATFKADSSFENGNFMSQKWEPVCALPL